MIDALRQDLSYALRRLRQAPGFTLVAVATLALGIGATSAIFSVVNAVLLRPLPFPEPGRLVRVAQTWEGRPAIYSPQNFLDVAVQATSFSSLAAIDTNGVTLTGQGAAARLEGAEVSAAFFDVLRVRPLHGRGFVTGENEPGTPGWPCSATPCGEDRFGSDSAIVGRTASSTACRTWSWTKHRASPSRGRRHLDADGVRQGLPHGQLWRLYLTVVGRLRDGATVDGKSMLNSKARSPRDWRRDTRTPTRASAAP